MSVSTETAPASAKPAPVKESRPPATATPLSAITLYRDARAPSRGRHALIKWIGKHDPLLPDVLLVASELLTNAVIHPAHGPGRESVTLRMSLGDSLLLVEVIDPGTPNRSPLPQPKQAAFPAETGRGLGLVAAYAAAWGTYITEAGCRNVWAVMKSDAPGTTPG
ncbi:ATP-binding protein [Nonomuraea sp. 10N515B]|uniref:ATP-binding protein n=1 Tax=Nonomuraea sp. 10N515B TaxID=3457422 RepID=UPI003FCC7728